MSRSLACLPSVPRYACTWYGRRARQPYEVCRTTLNIRSPCPAEEATTNSSPSSLLDSRMMQVSLTHLPNEVILHILFYLPPDCVPALQQVSQRFNDLAQPLLWKYHCRTQFKHWSEEHCMREKLSDNASKVDWKLIFTKRHNIDRAVSRELDSILSSQLGRNEKIQRIACFGYDAKDTLLRHLNIGEEAEDVLARR